MKAVLRGLHSPDVDDLRSWQPDSDLWHILVQASLGPEDGPGEESFDFEVCSRQAVSTQVEANGRWWSQHALVLDRWDFIAVESAVNDLLAKAEASDWATLAGQLSRYMDWEFTNYRPA